MADAPSAPPGVIRFGTFEVDLRSGELRKAGVRLALQDQPFRILTMLLARPGEVITREALRQALWPADTFVDFEHGLNAAVRRLREALGDDAEAPRFVETVPRRGYRFIAPVDDARRTPAPASTPTSLRSRWVVASTAVALLGAVGLAVVWGIRATPPLTETDYIVLADFTNRTNEPLFDGTLEQAVAVKLGESTFLNIVSGERVQETLRFMRRAPDEPVTRELGREICERQNAKALVTGDIVALGARFVVGLEALACHSGEVLVRTQEEAANKESVLRALDRATADVRRKLGESLPSIEARNTPLERATTSSLEALKAFSEGESRFILDQQLEAIPFYRRAIELDPDFAMAHAKMGVAYGNKGESKLLVEHLTRAFELRDRAGERERLYITAHYHRLVRGEAERAREVYEVWKATYPTDASPVNALALMDLQKGERERALSSFQTSVRVDPRSFFYGNLAWMYINLGRLQDARATLDEDELRAGADPVRHASLRFVIALLEGDQENMRREVAAMRGSPDEAGLVTYYAQATASLGRLSEADGLYRKATELATRLELRQAATSTVANAAWWDAEVGYCARMKDRVRALAASRTPPVAAYGTALAQCADAAQAGALLSELEKTGAGGSQLRARLEIRRGNTRGALELLGPAGPTDLGGSLNPLAGLASGLAIVYVRGLAHLAAGDGEKAVVEFQKIVDNRGIAALAPYHALAPRYLARAHALAGDRDKAREWYARFFDRWKDADPDVPILTEARAEHARLTAR